jgi:tartrate dehydrogenase/decarboxylase/D-malate dehydrogenase
VLRAIEAVLTKGPRTPDMGGRARTVEVGEAIAREIYAA